MRGEKLLVNTEKADLPFKFTLIEKIAMSTCMNSSGGFYIQTNTIINTPL